jgi:hypothetical protein
VGISLAPALAAAPWSPAALFAAGEKGAWYDPSDLSSMRQDSNGTVPAALDSPVGLLIDKSGSGLDQGQAVAARRPMLRFDGARHYLEFDGTDDILERGGMLVQANGSVTCAAAVRRTAAGAFPYITGNTGDNGFSLLYSGSSGIPRGYIGTSGGNVGATSAVPVADGADHVLKLVLDRPALGLTLFENGEERISAAAVDSNLTEGAVNYLGGHGGNGVYFPGRLYGFVIISRLLTTQETRRLEACLAAKAGIAA